MPKMWLTLALNESINVLCAALASYAEPYRRQARRFSTKKIPTNFATDAAAGPGSGKASKRNLASQPMQNACRAKSIRRWICFSATNTFECVLGIAGALGLMFRLPELHPRLAPFEGL